MNLDTLIQSDDPFVRLAGHQIGMYLAYKRIDTQDGLDDWRAHNRAAAALRDVWGPTHQCYPFPNKALVQALYASLRERLITRPEFVACMASVSGRKAGHV